MLNITTLKKRKEKMDTQIVSVSILILTLLNLGLVMIALVRLNGLRRDLRTPVVKKFNADFKRKSVDIPKIPENFSKSQHDKPRGRAGNQQSLAQNRPKNNSQQNRPMQIRRPAVKAPDVFSNEASAAPSPVPPRPVATESALAAEGRRPLPPRYNAVANATAPVSFGTAPAELAPMVPAPVSPVANDNGEGAGMEFDRSKMAHGRRNVVAKPVIEDEEAEA